MLMDIMLLYGALAADCLGASLVFYRRRNRQKKMKEIWGKEELMLEEEADDKIDWEPAMPDGQVTLKVLEAYTDDVGRGVARIDYDAQHALNVWAGDVLEIGEKRKIVAKCLSLYPTDESKGIVRINELIRNNAGVAVGDVVAVKKVEAPRSKWVVVAPLEDKVVAAPPEAVPPYSGESSSSSFGSVQTPEKQPESPGYKERHRDPWHREKWYTTPSGTYRASSAYEANQIHDHHARHERERQQREANAAKERARNEWADYQRRQKKKH